MFNCLDHVHLDRCGVLFVEIWNDHLPSMDESQEYHILGYPIHKKRTLTGSPHLVVWVRLNSLSTNHSLRFLYARYSVSSRVISPAAKNKDLINLCEGSMASTTPICVTLKTSAAFNASILSLWMDSWKQVLEYPGKTMGTLTRSPRAASAPTMA